LPNSLHRLGLIIDCFLSNFLFLERFMKVKNQSVSQKIIFEDFYLHPRLFIFNFLIRLFMRNFKIITLDQLDPAFHKALGNFIIRLIDQLIIHIYLKQAHLILCNSKFTQNQILSRGIHKSKIHLVYCGYDTSIQLQERKEFKKQNNKYHILFVGKCAKVKGLEYLIKAILILENNDIILDIVGNTEAEPSYFKRLTRLIKYSKLKDNIIFHGQISDRNKLSNFYRKSDIFVFPSLNEGFGIVLLEAMSYGLPILATKSGAIPELVTNDVNGLLVLPFQPEALAAAIQHLIINPDLRKRYSQAGYNFLLANRSLYSWSFVGERILKAFDTILCA